MKRLILLVLGAVILVSCTTVPRFTPPENTTLHFVRKEAETVTCEHVTHFCSSIIQFSTDGHMVFQLRYSGNNWFFVQGDEARPVWAWEVNQAVVPCQVTLHYLSEFE